MDCGDMDMVGDREEDEKDETEGEVRLAWEDADVLALAACKLSESFLSATGLYLPAPGERATLSWTHTQTGVTHHTRSIVLVVGQSD